MFVIIMNITHNHTRNSKTTTSQNNYIIYENDDETNSSFNC